jgi:hypothetical protein
MGRAGWESQKELDLPYASGCENIVRGRKLLLATKNGAGLTSFILEGAFRQNFKLRKTRHGSWPIWRERELYCRRRELSTQVFNLLYNEVSGVSGDRAKDGKAE